MDIFKNLFKKDNKDQNSKESGNSLPNKDSSASQNPTPPVQDSVQSNLQDSSEAPSPVSSQPSSPTSSSVASTASGNVSKGNDLSAGATILIAEDEQDLREILVEKMEESGFKALAASDGEKCMELALANHPDLILLDLYMPKSSGFDVIDKLINDPWGEKAKVVVLTNRGDFNSQRKVFQLKHVSYLIKAETSLEELVSEVKKKLNESYEETLSTI